MDSNGMAELGFHKEMFEKVLEHDCLSVAAKGLGLDTLMIKLIRLACMRCACYKLRQSGNGLIEPLLKGDDALQLEFRKQYQKLEQSSRSASDLPSSAPLIFVLTKFSSTSQGKSEAELLRDSVLENKGDELKISPPVIVSAGSTRESRRKLYVSGGCFIITSRIMLHDLLDSLLDPANITGLIVAHAHLIKESSNEAFVLDILHASQSRFKGWVKGFSDSPESLGGKIGQLSMVMVSLGVEKLFLWPRFHVAVRKTFEACQPEVIECLQPLTDNMLGIQQSIVSLIDSCLERLRDQQQVDLSDWNANTSLFKDFSISMRRQLKPVWSTISLKTKQLIQDISNLSSLLSTLVKCNPVQFFWNLETLLQTYRADAESDLSKMPDWLLTDASDRIFGFVKRRIYRIRRKTSKLGQRKKRKTTFEFDSHSSVATALDHSSEYSIECTLSRKLEENPKIIFLRKLIKEIRESERTVDQAENAGLPFSRKEGKCDLVILCPNEEICDFVSKHIREEDGSVLANEIMDKFFAMRFSRFCGQYGLNKFRNLQEASKDLEQDRQKLYDDLLKLQEDLFFGRWKNFSSDSNANVDGPNVGKMQASADYAPIKIGVDERLVVIEHIIKAKQFLLEEKLPADGAFGENGIGPTEECLQFPSYRVIAKPKHDIHVSVLYRLAPKYVITFDPDVCSVRNIELYQCLRPQIRIRFYFLQYLSSVEEQRYLADIKRERDAFRKLIDDKASLVIPRSEIVNATAQRNISMSRGREVVGYDASSGKPIFRHSLPSSKRKTIPLIVVDIREDRCKLPFMLHRNGVMIKTASLSVGDYILAPEICVERKSVPDLNASLRSGRLCNQLENMCRYYSNPYLLIEYDENSPLILGSKYDDVISFSRASLMAKIALVVINFPSLRILWSSGPAKSVRLFQYLKINYAEPDPRVAVRIGSRGSTNKDTDDPEFDYEEHMPEATHLGNFAAQDLLLHLPGITQHNYTKVLSNIVNLRKLSELTEDELRPLLGVAGAKQLFNFFNEALETPNTGPPDRHQSS